MKQIEDNLNEILEVLNGNGVPNNDWIRKQIAETLELVKNNGVLDGVIKCNHHWIDCRPTFKIRQCSKCLDAELIK